MYVYVYMHAYICMYVFRGESYILIILGADDAAGVGIAGRR